MSEFGGLWKHQTNPACTESVSLHHVEVGHYTKEEEEVKKKKVLRLRLWTEVPHHVYTRVNWSRTHGKDPVVHVTVRWIMGTLKIAQHGRKTREEQRVCALEATNNNNNNSCCPQWLIPLLLLSICILRLSPSTSSLTFIWSPEERWTLLKSKVLQTFYSLFHFLCWNFFYAEEAHSEPHSSMTLIELMPKKLRGGVFSHQKKEEEEKEEEGDEKVKGEEEGDKGEGERRRRRWRRRRKKKKATKKEEEKEVEGDKVGGGESRRRRNRIKKRRMVQRLFILS